MQQNDYNANSPINTYTNCGLLNIANKYRSDGLCPTPVIRNSKKAILPGWEKRTLTEQEIATYFGDQSHNIGVVLGTRSNGLIDIDIDDDHALQFAEHFLPATTMIFGRKSRLRSHWLYSCKKTTTKKYILDDRKPIIELRGDGAQTVFPGSVHECGEVIEFDTDGAPAEIDRDALELACEKLCLATVLLKHWNNGSRHELALAVSGLLAKAHWEQAATLDIIATVARAANDTDISDREKCVSTTYAKLARNEPVRGYEMLCEILGQKIAERISQWARSSSDLTLPPPAMTASEIGDIDLSSDTAAAEAFVKTYKGKVIFCENTGEWYRRDRQLYRPMTAVAIQGVAVDFTRKIIKEIAQRLPYGAVRSVGSHGRINGTVALSRSDLSVSSADIDQALNLVGLENGDIFDLAASKLTQSTKKIVTRSLGAALEAGAQCPHWLAFLDRIFDGDQDIINFVQRAVGYTLSGEVSEQCFFVLVGSGANGKSTFINALNKLFGDYAATIPMHSLMQQQRGNDKTDDLAMLPGKRFVTASEGEQGQRLAETRIKLITGGDKVSCRELYRKLFAYDPQFKLWLATNSLPHIIGVDEAIWRRIKVIRFPVTIPASERDPDLGYKLQAELPGILNWAIQGHVEWSSCKLNPPAQVTDETKAYRLDNDPVEQFIDACCVRKAGSVTSVKDLYDRYVEWSTQCGLDQIHKTQFGKTLAQKGFERKPTNKGTAWKGLMLKTDAD